MSTTEDVIIGCPLCNSVQMPAKDTTSNEKQEK
jgi:hypothetical protein